MTIGNEAVAIEADAHSPLRIAISEVLKRCIPEQPVEQQRLTIGLFCDRIGHQPRLIGLGLGPLQLLPLMKLPLHGSASALDGFPPGIGSPGCEPVTARSEVIQFNL